MLLQGQNVCYNLTGLTILSKRFQIESEVVVTTLKHINYSPQNPSPIKILKSNWNPRRAHENSKKRSVVEFEKWAKSVPLSFCHFFFAPLAASSCVRQTGKQGYKHLQPKHGLKPFSATCYLPRRKHVFWRQVLWHNFWDFLCVFARFNTKRTS